LRIASCESLKSLANAKLPPQLEELRIEQCEVLECLPDGLAFLHHLHSIYLKECPRLSWVPGDLLPTSLGTFWGNRLQEVRVSDINREDAAVYVP